ncbi:formate/nitrite transporter family protein [Rhodococcus antarcticus]|uniref:Formate/nitrite transporter family protein n=1 Tax=Rhodococcus antarcticus TaxID=2987751 RepID=A0ABY6NZF2_9NOCA|nr:formate/nitrite transporter family protein [Rhodococcus antarcticus]UZJ24765.1 formate/nitrite transporter family protein [Rhodococcus antarcticus]
MSKPGAAHTNRLSADPGERPEPEVEDAFDRLVGQGRERLARPLLPLVATGMLGGIDVGVGVLAYLVVEHDTGSALLGALAFTVGFVALLMAGSELFTENFLVPVVAVVAKDGTISQLLRLWVVSLAANLLTGLGMAAMIVYALPDVQDTAIAAGTHYAELGITVRSFLLAVLAGAVITLLTRMQNATDNLGIKIVPAIMLSFVLVAAKLFHCVLDSILMFAGLLTGRAPYSWANWASALGWSATGNIMGGLILVTGIRLLRVQHRVAEERHQS